MSPDAVSQHDQDALLRRLRDMEARARSLEQQLEASDRLAAVGALAAGLAHEFNNLLTPMSGIARLALSDPPDADLTRRALEAALAAADRGSRLAGSILSLAGDALGPPPRLTDAVANVADTVQGALACVARDPSRDSVSLRIHTPTTLAVAIPQPALRQVLLNLILNALHAMRSTGGGELTITATRSTWSAGDPSISLQINQDYYNDSFPPAPPSEPGGPPPGQCETAEGSPTSPSERKDGSERDSSLSPRERAARASGPGEGACTPLPPGERSGQQDAGTRPCVRITVEDTGPGVPADLLPHIFEPFVTTRTQPPPPADRSSAASHPPSPSGRGAGGEGANTPLHPGERSGERDAQSRPRTASSAGLGLAICRRLILAAAGDITAENAPPAGARFTITLPEA